jgi:hypothetical protein
MSIFPVMSILPTSSLGWFIYSIPISSSYLTENQIIYRGVRVFVSGGFLSQERNPLDNSFLYVFEPIEVFSRNFSFTLKQVTMGSQTSENEVHTGFRTADNGSRTAFPRAKDPIPNC